jgi:uncharacterized protein (DUF2267 family)
MSSHGLEGIDHSAQQAHIWINDLELRLGWDSKPRAYRLLKAVLQTLRDRLPINEATDLGAQLPTLIRGVYYDGWRPAHYLSFNDRHLEGFLDRIDSAFRSDPIDDTSEAVSAVFALLSAKISAGETADVRQSLPASIRALWPAPKQAERNSA